MRIWFAIGCLALVALMCIAVIVTTIAAGVMCPGYAEPKLDSGICIICAVYIAGIVGVIRRLVRNGKH